MLKKTHPENAYATRSKIIRTIIIINKIKHKLEKYIELIPFLFSPSNDHTANLVIVTGADSSHYKSLCKFLSSLFKHEPDIKAVVFDLGLSNAERLYLINTFPLAKVRVFDYSQYPDYFNIKVNAGEYAWKPVILSDTLNKFKCCVCWMDAGNLVTAPLFWLRIITKSVGMYSPYSYGVIADWTAPGTLKFLNTPNKICFRPNLNGACVSVDYQNLRARDLIYQWEKLALIKDCIAPIGSSRKNHRQDQSVLSVIAYQSNITKGMPSNLYGFKVQQDID